MLGLNVPTVSKEITAAKSLGFAPIFLATRSIIAAFSGVNPLILVAYECCELGLAG